MCIFGTSGIPQATMEKLKHGTGLREINESACERILAVAKSLGIAIYTGCKWSNTRAPYWSEYDNRISGMAPTYLDHKLTEEQFIQALYRRVGEEPPTTKITSLEQFKEEARKRGIVPGATVKNAYDGATSWVIGSPDLFAEDVFADGCFYQEKSGVAHPWLIWNGTWATVITPAPVQDDVIRVGDTVQRRNVGTNSGMNSGDTGVVVTVRGDDIDVRLPSGHLSICNHRGFLDKLKAGGPASTKPTTTDHVEVQRASFTEGSRTRSGRATELRVRGGQSAVGVRPTGHPQADQRPRADVAKGAFRPASLK